MEFESKTLPAYCPKKTVVMIGAPYADGQDLCGVEVAPQALRDAGIKTVVTRLGWEFEDVGDLAVDRHNAEPKTASTSASGSSNDVSHATGAANKNSKVFGEGENPYITNVKHSDTCGSNNGRLYREAYKHAMDGKFVLTVGGDHGLASGSISAMLKARPGLGVIWIDAHGDCNTPETSPSGNYHGMPLAHVLNWFRENPRGFEWMDECPRLPETRLAIIALRDLDYAEKVAIANSKVAAFSMKDVDRYSIAGVMERAVAHVTQGQGCEGPIHLSLDIDAVDPIIAPGTGTKARGGLTYREIHYICETVADTGRLTSMDLVEINPTLDPVDTEEMHGDDPEVSGTPTVRLGIELVSSALGKNIL